MKNVFTKWRSVHASAVGPFHSWWWRRKGKFDWYCVCFQAVVNGVEYHSITGAGNKKQAKLNAAIVCLQEFGVVPKTWRSQLTRATVYAWMYVCVFACLFACTLEKKLCWWSVLTRFSYTPTLNDCDGVIEHIWRSQFYSLEYKLVWNFLACLQELRFVKFDDEDDIYRKII